MTSFIRVDFPRCSICQEGFSSEEGAMAHQGGEQHPFHADCIERLRLHSSSESIQCPVCRIELSSGLPSNPLQNPAPSVQAANRQLESLSHASSFEQEGAQRMQVPEQWFDRLSTAEQLRIIQKSFEAGDIDESSYRNYVALLLGG